MKLSLFSVCSFGAGLALAIACDRPTGDQASKTNLSSASVAAPAAAPVDLAAIEAIAATRCEREQQCGNVGDGKKFENADACTNRVLAKGDGDLNTSACPGEIDTMRLQACLDQVLIERCDNPLDTVGRLSACRTDSLCPSGAR
jgi:hypothetical protein